MFWFKGGIGGIGGGGSGFFIKEKEAGESRGGRGWYAVR